MNAVSLRAERAVVDYLTAGDWSESGAGVPTCLTSYSHGLFADQDEEDTMPDLPIVVQASAARPVQRFDTTCEVDISVEFQFSADDTSESQILSSMQVLDNLLEPLFDDNGASVLDATAEDASGAFTAQFAVPNDFGGNTISNRSRNFARTFTLYCSATI